MTEELKKQSFFQKAINVERNLNHYSYLRNSSNHSLLFSSMGRESLLFDIFKSDSLLSNSIYSLSLLQSNANFTIVGGKKNVNQSYRALLNGTGGYRNFVLLNCINFYVSDIGAVNLLGFNSNSQLETITSLPSTQITSGDGYVMSEEKKAFDWRYTNIKGQSLALRENMNRFQSSDINAFRLIAFPIGSSPIITPTGAWSNPASMSAVRRVLNYSEMMYLTNEHFREELGGEYSKALLLLTGIDNQTFQRVLLEGREQRQNQDMQFYKSMDVLGSMAPNVDARLVNFTQMPENFVYNDFIENYMKIIALALGVPVDDIWLVYRGSTLGANTQVEIYENRGKERGKRAVLLPLQEQIQKFLPSGVHFTYDSSNGIIEADSVAIQKEYTSMIIEMMSAGLIDRNEARYMLASKQIIPNEWTSEEEPEIATDTKKPTSSTRFLQYDKHSSYIKEAKRWASELHQIRDIAAPYMKDEPIVLLNHSPENNTTSYNVLFERADDVLQYNRIF